MESPDFFCLWLRIRFHTDWKNWPASVGSRYDIVHVEKTEGMAF